MGDQGREGFWTSWRGAGGQEDRVREGGKRRELKNFAGEVERASVSEGVKMFSSIGPPLWRASTSYGTFLFGGSNRLSGSWQRDGLSTDGVSSFPHAPVRLGPTRQSDKGNASYNKEEFVTRMSSDRANRTRFQKNQALAVSPSRAKAVAAASAAASVSALETTFGGSGNGSSVLALAENLEGDIASEAQHLLEVLGNK